MAPKKAGAKLSSKVLTLTEVLKEYDVNSVQDLDDELLFKIYRLQDSKRCYEYPSDDEKGALDDDDPVQDFDEEPDKGVGTSEVRRIIRPAVHPYEACRNVWKCEHNAVEAETGGSVSSSKKRKSSEADDEGYSTSQVKGKGKEKALNQDGCSKDACKDNPRCLNHLGQEKWENDKKAYEMFARQWGLGDNPLDDLRDPDVPVGLKNLGATCYANSFMQVWFQHEAFRAAVYAYRPRLSVPLDQQSIFQLQVVFAALEAGNAKAYNPEPLVKALRVDQTVQQDAQEFAKLFMERMDEDFKAQLYDNRLKNLISEQFEGTISYSTECSGCKVKRSRTSTFRELEITLKNNRSLEELLVRSLAPEYLEGDNQYRCEGCAGLRDAKRSTEILTLPPILHFSLLRFVFDPETMDRKKSSGMVTFPKSIQMDKYLSESQHVDAEVWYDLKGVLLHRGGSAYSGHYTAHIYDAKHRDWYIFDDETVYQENIVKESKTKNNATSKPSKPASREGRGSAPRPVDKNAFYSSSSRPSVSKKLDSEVMIISDSEDERNAQLLRTPREGSAYRPSTLGNGDSIRPSKRQKGNTIDDSDDDRELEIPIIKSRDAYMLIYTKREVSKPPNGTTDITMPEYGGIPSRVEEQLRQMEKAQAAAMTVYNDEEKECKAAFERLRAAKRSVYSCWEADENDEAGYLVSVAELERWMVAEIDPPKKKKATAASSAQSDRDATSTDDDDCVYVVATPTVRSETPHKPASRSKPDPQKKTPQKTTNTMELDESGDNEELPDVSRRKGPASASHNLPGPSRSSTAGASSTAPRSASASLPEEANGHSVEPENASTSQNGKSATPQPGHGVVPVTHVNSSGLLCRHDKVDPKYISKIKYVSQRGLDVLESLGVAFEPKLPILQSLCKECVVQTTLDKSYVKKHRKHVSDYKACAKDSDPQRWISKAWLAEWQKEKPSFHRDGVQDAAPDSEDYIDDVFCCCDDRRLQPDQSKRQMISETQTNYLRQHFPEWHPPFEGDKTCSKCGAAYETIRKAAATITKLAKKEKKHTYLEQIISRANGPFAQSKDYLPTQTDEKCFVISAAWLKDWRRWLGSPADLDRPGAIDLRPFFCKHQRLIVDLNFPGDKENLEIVSTQEWEELCSIYTSFNDLTISVVYEKMDGNRKVRQKPGICTACRTSARSNFEQIQIRLYFLTEEDLDTSCQPKNSVFGGANQRVVIDLSEDLVEDKPVEEPGRRRSTRTSKKPGEHKATVKRRPAYKVTVKRLDTLRDIRVAIEKKTEIPILYQKIYFQGKEIEDASETIESIGITDQETLFVQELIAYDDDVDISMLVDEGPRRSKNTQTGDKKANNRAEGFGGTGLLGFSAPSTAAAEEAATIVAAMPGTCTQCTFLNAPDLAFCEVCENPLQA